MNRLCAALAVCIVSLVSIDASAFCGFYVGGAGAELFNDASQVVLMRDGVTTVLSMQNRYEGPVDDFAMVVPVPQVLMEENVKTLDPIVFEKLDRLTAPRLVEYYEEDPCAFRGNNTTGNNGTGGPVELDFGPPAMGNDMGGVLVEAQFTVGEYEIVILSTGQSTALESWLADNGYNVPAGSATYYEPYVEAGMYFFVARVDSSLVTFEGDRAVLSPLRFHYLSPTFSLPIRLGMINSAGQQDIIIHTLARSQRYASANYANTTIPTNLELTPDAKGQFGTFYKALFGRTVEANPGAIITEYAWSAGKCDPCPAPVMDPAELLTLGADVVGGGAEFDGSWVVTRMHARFAKNDVGEDIMFEGAAPIAGGREQVEFGSLEKGARPANFNNFQGRYIIRHPWTGAVECDSPTFGIWGPPQNVGSAQGPTSVGGELDAAEDFSLASVLVDDIDDLNISGEGARGVNSDGTSNNANNGMGGNNSTGEKPVGGGGCSTIRVGPTAGLFVLLALVGLRRRR